MSIKPDFGRSGPNAGVKGGTSKSGVGTIKTKGDINYGK